MKKVFGLIALVTVFTTLACGDEKKTEVKKEVVVVPVNQNPPEKNTTISLDKNGVKVSTKKVDVKIEGDGKKN